MSDCIFCKIAAGEIPATVVYQDEEMLVFEDISPKAPLHLLLIPKQHMATLNEAGPEQAQLLGRLILKAGELAEEKGVSQGGYRVQINCNPDGGQVVFHLHVHLMGGRKLECLT